MSRPSITTSQPAAIFCCKATSARRTDGQDATSDAAIEISGVRISFSTSSPPSAICWLPSTRSTRISAFFSSSASAASSCRSVFVRTASSPTVRYIAPVSR